MRLPELPSRQQLYHQYQQIEKHEFRKAAPMAFWLIGNTAAGALAINDGPTFQFITQHMLPLALADGSALIASMPSAFHAMIMGERRKNSIVSTIAAVEGRPIDNFEAEKLHAKAIVDAADIFSPKGRIKNLFLTAGRRLRRNQYNDLSGYDQAQVDITHHIGQMREEILQTPHVSHDPIKGVEVAVTAMQLIVYQWEQILYDEGRPDKLRHYAQAMINDMQRRISYKSLGFESLYPEISE